MPVIGIDLGTKNSFVAVLQGGRFTVIENEEGKRNTPSCVAFTDDERFIGKAAVRQMMKKPHSAIYDVKRLIGRSFKDRTVQSDMRKWTFRVVNSEEKTKIQVQFKGKCEEFYPEEISAMVLSKLKKIAENHLGEKITGAVITVPASFNDAQRRATKNAATIAGIPVLGLINESTAAAIAFGLTKKTKERRNVLVFHLGGGTCGATVVTIGDGTFDVKASEGSSHFGGEDFDDRVVHHFTAEFNRKRKTDKNITPKAGIRLRTACEKAKEDLGLLSYASMKIDAFVGGRSYDSKITRDNFTKICNDLMQKIEKTVKKALAGSNMDAREIHDIVLVGGSTRMYMVKDILTEKCRLKKEAIRRIVNADEAAAEGAAAMAALLSGVAEEEFAVHEIISRSVKLRTERLTAMILNRGASIPARRWFNIIAPGHTSLTKDLMYLIQDELVLLADSNSWMEENYMAANCRLEDVSNPGDAVTMANICFQFDADGLLEMGIDNIGGEFRMLDGEKGLLADEIKSLMRKAEHYQEDDQKREKTSEKLHALEHQAYELQKFVKSQETTGFNTRSEQAVCEALMKWARETSTPSSAEVEKKMKTLEDLRVRVYHSDQSDKMKGKPGGMDEHFAHDRLSRHKHQDEKKRETMDRVHALEHRAYEIQRSITSQDALGYSRRPEYKACGKILKWAQETANPTSSEIDRKSKTLEGLLVRPYNAAPPGTMTGACVTRMTFQSPEPRGMMGAHPPLGHGPYNRHTYEATMNREVMMGSDMQAGTMGVTKNAPYTFGSTAGANHDTTRETVFQKSSDQNSETPQSARHASDEGVQRGGLPESILRGILPWY